MHCDMLKIQDVVAIVEKLNYNNGQVISLRGRSLYQHRRVAGKKGGGLFILYLRNS